MAELLLARRVDVNARSGYSSVYEHLQSSATAAPLWRRLAATTVGVLGRRGSEGTNGQRGRRQHGYANRGEQGGETDQAAEDRQRPSRASGRAAMAGVVTRYESEHEEADDARRGDKCEDAGADDVHQRVAVPQTVRVSVRAVVVDDQSEHHGQPAA
jgi:hypothetical protein